MKVLHITGYITGGAGIAVMRLHRALLARGVDSKVLCLFALPQNLEPGVFVLNRGKRLRERILARLRVDRASRLTGYLAGDYETFTFPFSGYRLHTHPLVREADVIHLHWIADFVDIPSFFPAVKKPMLWTAHDLNPLMGGFHYEEDLARNPQFAAVERRLADEKQAFIRSSGVRLVGSSALTVEKIRSILPEVTCYQVPCVLETVGFVPVGKSLARQALGIDPGPLVLGVGADDLKNRRKGYWLLKEALLGLTDVERAAIRLVSFGMPGAVDAGTGQEPQKISFGVMTNRRVHALVYSVMDYFVSPSLEETFGLTGSEAMLCDTPLIASRTGAVPDYAGGEASCLLFEPGSAAGLKEHIRRALAGRGDRVSAGSTREHILSWYAAQDPVGRHIALYRQLT